MMVRKAALYFTVLMTLMLGASSFSVAAVDRIPASRPSASGSGMASETPMQGSMAPMPVQQGTSHKEYILGAGDRIKLTVFGEAELSGEYEVGSTGVVAMPLIGDIQVAGQPLRVFEQAVRQKLSQGYLRDPRVSAQVVNYRPFFILGEVSKPGSYPYVNGMTIVNAVALAGGYTYRADRDEIMIKHANDPQHQEVHAPEESIVMPGDVIRVPERFF